LLGLLFFPRSPTNLWTILYYSLAVPHGLLLISLVSVALIKFGSVEILRELHVHRIIRRDEAPPEVTDSPVY